jgi:hypothetical protein
VVRYPRNPNRPGPTLNPDGPYIKLTEILYYVATGQHENVDEICREVIEAPFVLFREDRRNNDGGAA